MSQTPDIPLVDFSIYDETGGREKVGKQIAEVLKTAGFMYVKNHGVRQNTVRFVLSSVMERLHQNTLL